MALSDQNPAVLAKLPEDGRLHLLSEEIDLHTLTAGRLVFDPEALDQVIEGQVSRILAPSLTDEVLTLEFRKIKTRSANTHTLQGHVVGEETTSDVQIVYHDGILHGSIARHLTGQEIEYTILADGHMMVRELDQSSMIATCGNGSETMGDSLPENLNEDGMQIVPQDGGEPAEDTIGSRVVDLVVGYDQGARVAQGGYSQIEARIISSVDRMSTAFANSLITNTELMLLGTIEDPDYVYPGSASGSMGEELVDLNNFNNGPLDTVSDYATQLGADFVSFVLGSADGSAGIAYRPGRASITARTYMTSTRITFGHELGHNLGCDHSWGDSSQDYHSHYGWRLDPDGDPSTKSDQVRTIMAYDWGWGIRIPHFANPNVFYNGVATGAVNGYNVLGDLTADQRYYQTGLSFSNQVYGFNGAQAGLAANNAGTIHSGSADDYRFGATYASNRSTRTSFNVTSPVAGTVWERGTSRSVSFNGGDMEDLATIKLYKGGVPHSTIASGLNPATDRDHPWSLPPELASDSDYMIRVELDRNGSTLTADSGMFTIIGITPRVISQSPLASTADVDPVSQLSLSFNEVMNPATFSVGDDIISFTDPDGTNLKPSISGTSWTEGNTVLNISFPAQSRDGAYELVLGSQIQSADGVFLDQDSDEIPGEPLEDRYTAAFGIISLDGSLDATGITWLTTGDLPWFPQTNTTYDGADAAQSGAITHNQTSSLETTFNKPGTLTFYWKVSSENGWDYLRFYINGVEQGGNLARISGNVDWIQKTVTIPSGSNTVRWSYTKDVNTDSGSDAGWIDQVVFTPDFAPEIVVEQPVDTDLVDGSASIDFGSVDTGGSSSPFVFTIRNVGTEDLTGLALSKTGTNSANYTLGSLGASTLAPDASTTFTVTFSPSEAGTRTAEIQIASNDADENPFDINLTGTGLGPGTLAITPGADLTASGNHGGPFSPSSQQFTLSNPGSTSINWTASHSADWVTLDSTGGTLAAGAGTTVTVSISGNADTLGAGGYGDTVTFTNTTNSSGNTTRDVNLTVNPLSATVQLANLSQTYDGSTKPVGVTTSPSGLAYEATYNGSPNPPTDAGTYAVVATVTEPNYAGGASGNLTIAKAFQTITFPEFAEPIRDNEPAFTLSGAINSALAISYTSSNTAVATVSGNTLTAVGPGTTIITASQPGDDNHEAAPPVQRELTVFQTNLAEAVIYEPFDDPNSTLSGNTVGKGLAGTWLGNGAVVADSLNYGNLPAGTGSTASVNNQNAYVSTGTTLANTGLLDDGASLWFSVLVRTGGDIATNGDLGFALGTDQLNSGNNLPVANSGQALGFTFKQNQIRASHWAPTLNRSSTNSGNGASPDTLSLVVGKITWGDTSETIEIYRPATNLILGNAVSTYTTSANLNQSQFDTVSFSSKSATPAHLFDEIRFGASYESVIGLGGSTMVDHFAISPISSPNTVGTPINGITITAMTASEETATSFTGNVTFGGTAGVTGTSANFVDGILTDFSFTPMVAGSDLTLTVDDGESHTGSVTIASIVAVYDSWSGDNGLSGDGASPDASPDGDALANLLEFAFGTNPTVANSDPVVFVVGGEITATGLPTLVNLAQPGQPADERAVFSRLKNHVAAGLTYTVEFSADLKLWTPTGVAPTVLTDANSTGDLEVVSVPFADTVPVSGGGAQRAPKFMRVVVSNGP